MSKILRDMRKGKKANATVKLNTSMYVNPGGVISHVAQGVLRDSRKIKIDHVIWKPEEDREHNTDKNNKQSIYTQGMTGGPVPYVS